MTPRSGGPAGEITIPFEDFVRPSDIRSVLLGSAPDLAVESSRAVDFDSFAGRPDVFLPPHAPKSHRMDAASAGALPVLGSEPPLVHPAFEFFEVSPPVRRAAPPCARPAADFEATFGRSKLSERWWVVGMGVAAAAILFSGTAVDFISREAVRRSRFFEPPVSQVIPPLPAADGQAGEERPEAIAAALQAEESP